jgi:hypothetical protein
MEMRTLWTSLLLLWPLMTPPIAEAQRERPIPEKVYRQLREEPVIRTREEALGYLAEASPSDLWKSAKLSVDKRIKHLLAHERFESLDEEIQSKLHASMLKIRSSFWTEDLEMLSEGEEGLREVWQSGKIVSEAENGETAQQLQDRVQRLVEEVQMAVALQKCIRAREEHDLAAEDCLECLLRGGPDG